MSKSGASRKIHWVHISQHQKTYLYSRMVFSNADKTTSNSAMSLAFFPFRHQICTESEISRILREVHLIYWLYFGSRPRVLKAYNKNCPTKLPKIAMVEEARGRRPDSLLPRPGQSHKSPSTCSLTAISLVLPFLPTQPEVPLTPSYQLYLYCVVCCYPTLLTGHELFFVIVS